MTRAHRDTERARSMRRSRIPRSFFGGPSPVITGGTKGV